MKTKIFLPVLAMLSLMLFSFTTHASSNNDCLTENTFLNQEIESFESTIFNKSVENISELDAEDALSIRITIRLRRVTIIIEIGFSMADGSGNTGGLEDQLLAGNLEGDNLIVSGFEGVDGSRIEIFENQLFQTETGVYEILPGSYEVNEGRVAFNVTPARG